MHILRFRLHSAYMDLNGLGAEMAREKLTAGKIRDFATGKTQAFLWDTEAPGLAVRATPSGAKAYIFQGKLNGKDLRVTIGDVRAWLLDNSDPERPGARQEARRLQSLVDQGTDPREQKRERIAASEAKREEARRQGVTVQTAWDAYLEARKGKWSPRHLADHQQQARGADAERRRGKGPLKPGPLAALMPLELAALTPAKVASWLEKETKTRPTAAALAYRLLRAFLNWCAEQEEYQGAAKTEAVSTRKVKELVPRARVKDDVLQREQLPAWFKAMGELSNPVMRAYLVGLLLTGARSRELQGLKWADVDFQWGSLRIADKVEEGGRVIPLTPYLASLLAPLPRRSEWVFSSVHGNSKSGRIEDGWFQHSEALQKAGLPHVSLHGLRRSFGTLAEWVECPVGVVAQIQGHKPSATAEKHYRRRPLDLLRMWHTRIEAWILEQAGIQQPKPEEAAKGLRVVEGAK